MTSKAIDPGALSLIAAGLQSQLEIVFPSGRFQFGFMPPRLSPKEWAKLVNRPPFIGLGWNEFVAEANGTKLFKGRTNWTVYLVIENKSGVKGRYLGDAQGPGLFQLVQAAIVALQAYHIPDASGGHVGSCVVQRASNAFAEGWEAEDLAMAAVDVTVNTTLSVPSGLVGAEATPDLLKDIASSWSFDDGAGVINDVSEIGQAA